MKQKNTLWRSALILFIVSAANNGYCEDSEATIDAKQSRMVDSEVAGKHSYPFVVLLQVKQNGTYNSLCNGILIDDDTILTTVQRQSLDLKPEVSRALAGMHNGVDLTEYTRQIRDICYVEVHPSRSKNKNAYMFLHTSEPFHLNEYVRVVALPRIKNVKTVEGACQIAGWGSNSVFKMPWHKKTNIIPCTESYNLDKSVFCTEVGACTEFGAPVVCSRGNREFAAGTYINTQFCNNKSDVAIASFLTIDYKWLNEMKIKAVKKCRSYE